ncbi:MAG TPA: hypothetical protein PL131_00715 [Methylotenera sp.]|nr:hypothetical protein [Methylotenera sp.]HPH04368.1 hypothetical protein [Methylotenera sp.]HPM99922.1 hypothetical protein [Methylotenera sp.]
MQNKLICQFKSLLSAIVLSIFTFPACAKDNFPRAFDPTPIARFKPSNTFVYGPSKSQLHLKKLLLTEHKNKRNNHFCVIGYVWSDNEIAWVHWVEEKRLILWEQSDDMRSFETSLTNSRRDLKLGVDTVEKPEDINGSTYLVTREWWQAVAQDCAKHGQKITLKPFI